MTILSTRNLLRVAITISNLGSAFWRSQRNIRLECVLGRGNTAIFPELKVPAGTSWTLLWNRGFHWPASSEAENKNFYQTVPGSWTFYVVVKHLISLNGSRSQLEQFTCLKVFEADVQKYIYILYIWFLTVNLTLLLASFLGPT